MCGSGRMPGGHTDLYDPGLKDVLDESATPGRNSMVMHPTLIINIEEGRILRKAINAREQEAATDGSVRGQK